MIAPKRLTGGVIKPYDVKYPRFAKAMQVMIGTFTCQ
eukprot:15077.XXX_812339_812458_1 [CDS] Oithona nana genome sequencing.